MFKKMGNGVETGFIYHYGYFYQVVIPLKTQYSHLFCNYVYYLYFVYKDKNSENILKQGQ
jgi:hypothetical protein